MKPKRPGILFTALALLSLNPLSAETVRPGKVLIIGDSMMRITSHAVALHLERVEGVTSHAHSSLGTGLARLDVFDWMAKIDELVAEHKPDTTLAWFGTNDRQPMQREDGSVVQPADEGWGAEYSRRVALAMDKLTAAEGAKVYWLELPVMRDPKVNEDVNYINGLVRDEAEKRPAVTYLETRAVLGRSPDTYSPYVIGPRGMPLPVRDVDGVHLSRAGADRLAEHLLKIWFP